MSRTKNMSRLSITVNGRAHALDVEDRTLLVDLLRDELRLTGTHVGCDTSQCGCCTVHMDGIAVKSCTTLALQADGANVVTIEGLAAAAQVPVGRAQEHPHSRLHPVQAAFSTCHGLQCGYYTPGMIMATVDLLSRHPDPTDEQIRDGLAGNLCRCTGYVNIEAAVRTAAAALRR